MPQQEEGVWQGLVSRTIGDIIRSAEWGLLGGELMEGRGLGFERPMVWYFTVETRRTQRLDYF